MGFESPPTIFDMCLVLAQETERAPRQFWLDDPPNTAQSFLEQTMPRWSLLDTGAQRAVATQFICSGLWAASGYVTFDITHRLAATLMATKIDASLERHIVAPFPGFLVKLPDNLLTIMAGDNESSASVLMVGAYEHKGVPTLSYLMMAQAGVSVFGTNMPIEGFVSSDMPFDQGEVTPTDVDNRSSELARKLILGLCLYLSDPNKLGEPKTLKRKQKHSGGRNRAPGQLPAVQQYTLGREIQLDSNVITAVREYVRHGSKAPAVQYIVKGHWKMQPYGPGRAERRLIHIEPYWRGPVDAPILSHRGRT